MLAHCETNLQLPYKKFAATWRIVQNHRTVKVGKWVLTQKRALARKSALAWDNTVSENPTSESTEAIDCYTFEHLQLKAVSYELCIAHL